MSATHFERLGGEQAVRHLVDRFYDLMDLEPEYAGIRAMHPRDLSSSRDKLFWFLCGWTGGPQHFVERFGHPMLRRRHLPFTIGESERDQWMSCMRRAMREEEIEAGLQQELEAAFWKVADFMRNQ